jgi:RNA polymerase sigma-70 factor, ECF subfamily
VGILNANNRTMTRQVAVRRRPQPSRSQQQTRSSNSDELELVRRIVAGETELFHELVRPSRRMVFGVCLSVLRNRDEAEDAAQETMLKALKGLGRFRGESKFSTWLVAIALNEARARLPDRRVSSFEQLEYLDRESEICQRTAIARDESATPLDTLERSELHHALRMALVSLPKTYRQVLLLRKAEELSTEKTAGLLGVSKAVVKIRLLRARLMMRKKIAAQLQIGLRPSLRTPAALPCASCGG